MNTFEVIEKEQLEMLELELIECPDITQMILDKLYIRSLKDMPKNKFIPTIKKIREMKFIRNNEITE